MSINFESSGSFANTEAFLKQISSGGIFSSLERFGREGVAALAAATPTNTGETANSWHYEIVQDATSWSIIWGNSNVINGRPVAVLIQYGHGTRNGGYVEGRDYINPALQSVFDRIATEAWKLVTNV